MNNKIFIFIVILGILYKYFNIETFSNFKHYCNKIIAKDNKGKFLLATDVFGFKKNLKNKIKISKKNTKAKNCPIGLTLNLVAKYIKSNNFHYIIDTRSKDLFIKNNISGSINLSDLENNLNKINNLDIISRESDILVIGDKDQFYVASKIKELGKFNNIFYIKNGNYNKLRNVLRKIKNIDYSNCLSQFRYKSLCIN